MNPAVINRSLRILRLYWGKSQAELATELEISQSYLSEVETGRKDVTIDLLDRYSKRLSVPMSSLLLFAEGVEGAPPARRGQVFVAGKVLKLLERLIPDDVQESEN